MSGTLEALACLNELGIYFFRLNPKFFNCFLDNAALQLPLASEGVECGNGRQLGIDLEKPPEPFASVAAPKTISAEGRESTRNPGSNLVGNEFDIVGNGNEWPFFFLEQLLHIRFARRFGGMQHIPALRSQSIVPKQLVA